MPNSDPIPTLDYSPAPDVRWREDGEDLLLILPPRPKSDLLAEGLQVMLASTLFALAGVGTLLYWNLAAEPVAVWAIGYGFGLFSIGQWVLIAVRLYGKFAATRGPYYLRVTPTALLLEDATAGYHTTLQGWKKEDIVGLRLDPKQPTTGAINCVRLQVVNRGQEVSAVTLPWPSAQPLEPHETKLRAAVRLPPRLSH